MPNAYFSPGVFVEEVPASVQAIAGVGTSTAGFLALVPDTVSLADPNPDYDPTWKPPTAPVSDKPVKGTVAGATGGVDDSAKDDTKTAATATKDTASSTNDKYTKPFIARDFKIAVPASEPRLFTNFAEFKRSYGDFSTDRGHNLLVHAVFGFFNNGGSRVFIVRMTSTAQIQTALEKLEAVDEVAIVAAPGVLDDTVSAAQDPVRAAIVAHCDKTANRFAVLDTPELVATLDESMLPGASKNAALYFPWLQVFDPGLKTREPGGKGLVFVPPSGHMAGIYARVDTTRGVFKAPANEVVLGALGLKYPISKAQQDGLNPRGINCIRSLNGNIRVWGARTVGGERNGEWKYVNVRRTFLYLRKSIDEGTQWVVFEPNDLGLWAKITRNVSAFLVNVWRDGALFGSSASEAFYVKCDRETNPPELRELGQVVTEIGVSMVRPAEFVIFRVSQWVGPEGK